MKTWDAEREKDLDDAARLKERAREEQEKAVRRMLKAGTPREVIRRTARCEYSLIRRLAGELSPR
jgi:F0F1-type ATP synthase membrane subunit b/b'